MQSNKFFLGIDNGGSKTIAVLALDDGTVVGIGKGNISDHTEPDDNEYTDTRMKSIDFAVSQAIQYLGDETITIECAGAVPKAKWVGKNPGYEIKKAISIMEGISGLASVNEKYGITVIAGTGTAVQAILPGGTLKIIGGWGHLMGDKGSGYWISIKALEAVADAEDGLGKKTLIKDKIIEYCGFTDIRQLQTWLYVPQKSRSEIASLFPSVLEACNEGDEMATQILTDAGKHLARVTILALKNYGEMERIPVVPIGGVFKYSKVIMDTFTDIVRENSKITDIIIPDIEPVAGALFKAMEEYRIKITPEIINRTANTFNNLNNSVQNGSK